ncbi:nodulation protein NfeD [bacterium]|nr:nodulation protein NfeD [bacterium]
MKNRIIFLTTICFALLLALQSNWSLADKTVAAKQDVHYFKLDTEVHFGMSGFVKRVIQKAKNENAAAIIIGIDTFGGRVDSALEIIEHINAAQDLPVYAYIEDKAWSAGALLALGCKAIYMKSGSSIGSATPVSAGGGQAKTEALGEKYISAIRAKFRSVAEKNGYPPNLAAAMVDKDLEVWQVSVNDQTKYLTQDEIDLAKKEKKEVSIGPKVTAKGKLLNLTAQQSLAYGLSQAMIENKEALLQALEMPQATIVVQERNWTEFVAGFLTSSMISGLLMMIGLIALYTEISNPGFGWAGIVGITALGLLFWGKYIVNLAEMTEFMIFAVGIILLLVEIFVIPGFGITGIAGIAFMCIGLYLAFVPFVIPKYPWDFTLFTRTLVLMFVSILTSITGFLILLHFLPSLPGLNRLVLTREQRQEDGFSVATESTTALIGSVGKATTTLRPVGKGQFGQKLLDVVAESGFIEKDTSITIIDVTGNRILVRPS